MALEQELSAADQALMEQMRASDAQPGSEPAATPEPAPPAGEPDPAPAAEPAVATEPAQQRAQMVPHAALHEAREEVKREKERNRLLEERTNLILQRMGQPQAAPQPQPQAQPIPELDKDPAGHIVGLLNQQGMTVQQLAQIVTGQMQQQQQQSAAQNLQNRAVAMEREFASVTPDYGAAISFLTDARHKELAAIGYTDPADRQTIIQNEAMGVAARAMQLGQNPAEFGYALAKQRGFQAPAPAPAVAAQPVEPDAAAERLRTVAAGQQASRSLGNVRGSGPAQVNANTILALDDTQFKKWLDGASDTDKQAVFGA